MAAKKKTRKTSRKTTKKRARKKAARKSATKRGPGRRLTDAEQKRRTSALKKHGSKDSPQPLTGQQIADKLGINIGTWNVWKSNQKKGGGVRTAARRGRPRKSGSSLDGVVADFRALERETDQLRNVLGEIQRALTKLP